MSFESRPRSTFLAVGLIVAGTLLFLDNLGIVPIRNLGAYWPLALVVYGLGMIYYRRSATVLVWAATLILAGILLVLGNLGIVHANVGSLWPLFLIAGGALMLIHRAKWDPAGWDAWVRSRRMEWKDWAAKHGHHRRYREQGGWGGRASFTDAANAEDTADAGDSETAQNRWSRSTYSGGRVNEAGICFSSKRRVEVSDFQGGELVAVMGSIEIDLTDAQIQLTTPRGNGGAPVRRAILNATAVFGGIDIAVPRNWRVVKEGAGVFGSYEDKTVPRRNEPGVEPATLIVRGGAVFGSVTIRN